MSNAGTITNAYGLFCDTGAISGLSAIVIVNGYGAYINIPAYGFNKIGINISGTQTTTASSTLRALSITPTIGCSVGTLSAAQMIYTFPDYSANTTTITTAYGILIDPGATAGTITKGYSLYVANPAYGTSKYCAYFGGGVGIGATPPNNVAGLTLATSGGTPSTLDFYEEITYSGTWQSNGGGGVASASANVYVRRIGKLIIAQIAGFRCTTTGSVQIIQFSQTFEARFRPVILVDVDASLIVSNAVYQTTPGFFALDASGGLYLYFKCDGSGFPASQANSGTDTNCTLCYAI